MEKAKKTEEKSSSLAKIHANENSKIVAIIRITGEVKVKPDVVNTLYRLRLRRKYTCTLINPNNKGLMGMLFTVRHSVAYGEISKETLIKLLNARAEVNPGLLSSNNKNSNKAGSLLKSNEKKAAKAVNYEEIAEELMKGKKLEELRIKPFFRLHPPRGGIKSKLQYPQGILGDNKGDINKLIERML